MQTRRGCSVGSRGVSLQSRRGQRQQDELQEPRTALLSWGGALTAEGVGWPGHTGTGGCTGPEGPGKPPACFYGTQDSGEASQGPGCGVQGDIYRQGGGMCESWAGTPGDGPGPRQDKSPQGASRELGVWQGQSHRGVRDCWDTRSGHGPPMVGGGEDRWWRWWCGQVVAVVRRTGDGRTALGSGLGHAEVRGSVPRDRNHQQKRRGGRDLGHGQG